MERLRLLAIMDFRARSISFASRPRRPYGPPDHERAGETFSPSPHSDSQTSAGKPTIAFGISLSRPLGAAVARSSSAQAALGKDNASSPTSACRRATVELTACEASSTVWAEARVWVAAVRRAPWCTAGFMDVLV
jgi:hypothetical protein